MPPTSGSHARGIDWFTRTMTAVSDRPISVVVVGFGLGGRVFHAPLVSCTPGLSLDGIVTAHPDRAAAARAAHPDATVHATAQEAWDTGYDLAVISTANVTHVPFASEALASGQHVVLDKPIAPNAREATLLRELAAANDRLLIPFQNRRWDSDFLTARRVAAEGAIGTVHRFDSRLERMRVVPKDGWRNSTAPEDMGGMLYDLGAHVVDQALQLMGPVTSVMAAVRTVRPVDGTDDDVVLVLEHVSGAISQLTVSQVSAFGRPRLTLLATRGGLRIEDSDTQEQALAAGRRPTDADWGREPAGSDALLRLFDDASVAVDSRRPLDAGRWPAFYAGVESALRGTTAPPVLLDDVIENLRVLDAARTSAAQRRVVTLDPPAGHHASSTW